MGKRRLLNGEREIGEKERRETQVGLAGAALLHLSTSVGHCAASPATDVITLISLMLLAGKTGN